MWYWRVNNAMQTIFFHGVWEILHNFYIDSYICLSKVYFEHKIIVRLYKK